MKQALTRRACRVYFAALALLLLVACGRNDSTLAIAPIADQTIGEDGGVVSLIVSPNGAETLVLRASSSQQNIVPDSGLEVSGSGSVWSLAISPSGAGSTTITIEVSDERGGSASSSFLLRVSAAPRFADDFPETVNLIAGQASEAITFSVSDAEGDSITVTARAEDSTLIPPAGLVVSGSGTTRSLVITPAAGASGSSRVIVQASDGLSSRESSFVVNISPTADQAPSISAIGDQQLRAGESRIVSFSISDAQDDPGSLELEASSSNPERLPNANLVISGSGSTRSLSISVPSSASLGEVTVTLSVRNSLGRSGQRSFGVIIINGDDGNGMLSISAIDDQIIPENSSTGALPFSISGAGQDPGSLVIEAFTSENSFLVPNANIVIGGSGLERSVTVTPRENQAGSAEITIRVVDAQGRSASERFQVMVTASDMNAPEIDPIGDRSTPQNTLLVVPFQVRDADPGDLERLQLSAESSNSSLVPNNLSDPTSPGISFGGSGENRTLIITPSNNASGESTILVRVTDPAGLEASSSFTLTVTPVQNPPRTGNVPPLMTLADTAVNSANVLALAIPGEDSGAASQLRIGSVVSPTERGALVSINDDGSLRYDPNRRFDALEENESADDVIRYTILDGNNNSASGTIAVTVMAATENQLPIIAVNPLQISEEATPANEVLESIALLSLAQVTDPDGEDAALRIIALGASGAEANNLRSAAGAQLTINSDGTVTYNPRDVDTLRALAEGETFEDSFVYTVADERQGRAIGLAQLRLVGVNEPPEANDLSAETDARSAISLDVIANDRDPEGERLELIAIDASDTLGTVSILEAENGQPRRVRYDPAGAFNSLREGEEAQDSFFYTVADPSGATAQARVQLTIIGVNEPPRARPLFLEVAANSRLDFSDEEILARVTDPEGQRVTVVEVRRISEEESPMLIHEEFQAMPSQGQLELLGDGRYRYDPSGLFDDLSVGESDTDTLLYRVRDELGEEALGVVLITIQGSNQPPQAEDVPAEAISEVRANNVVSFDFRRMPASSDPEDEFFYFDPDDDINDRLFVTVESDSRLGGRVRQIGQLDSGHPVFEYDPRPSLILRTLEQDVPMVDSFDYVVSDGRLEARATVNIRVRGVAAQAQQLELQANLNNPRGIAVRNDGLLVFANTGSSQIIGVCNRLRNDPACPTPDTSIFLVNPRSSLNPNGVTNPEGVAVDSAGNIFIADTGNHRILRLDAQTLEVSVFAGSGERGFLNSASATAQFNTPTGLAVFSETVGMQTFTTVYVADSGNNQIRVIRDGRVETLAGAADQSAGSADGTGNEASFNRPRDVAVGSNGLVYVADTRNGSLRRIDPESGRVHTIVLPEASSSLGFPTSIAVDAVGNLYLSEAAITALGGNNNARLLVRDLDSDSSTPEFRSLLFVLPDRPNAFSGSAGGPYGIAVARDGTIYIANSGFPEILQVTQ